MNFFADNVLVIILLPFITALFCLLSYIYKLAFSNRTLNVLTVLSCFTGTLFSVCIFLYLYLNGIQDIHHSVNWLNIENYNFEAGIYIDKLSALFLSLLMIVGFAVIFYSIKYIKKNEKYPLYLFYLNILIFATGTLLLSSNLIQTYIFLELTGITCYLLINFDFEKSKITNSAKNFFVINKIGDTLFLTGIIILIYFIITYPVFNGETLLIYSDFTEIASDFYVYLSDGWYYVTCMLIFFGIIAKTAQFPLHIWINDASESSFPTNTLINTVTITLTGLYLSIRLLPLFELSIPVMNTILYIGLITALFCGLFAAAQNNIKKMLSYSTSSQLGLIVASIGLNLPFAAILYFLNHAFSKAVLFLSSASLYKISDEKNLNISDFNCSRKQYPVIAYCYFISIVALTGLFFAGATAKDLMINAYSASMQVSAIIIFTIVLFITAYYLFRSYFMIFERNNNTDNSYNYKFILSLPVILLTFFTIVLTFFPQNILEFFDKYKEIQQELINSNLKYTMTFFAILTGAVLGSICGIKGIAPFPQPAQILFLKGLYISKIYKSFSDNVLDIFRNIVKNFDKYVINGIFNIFVNITKFSAWILSLFQNGKIQSYIIYGIFLISLVIGSIGLILFLLRSII